MRPVNPHPGLSTLTTYKEISMGKPELKLVEQPEPELVIDWENLEARIPECLVLSDSLLEGEWFARQAEVDRNRRPVVPPKPPTKKEQRATQLEMFKKVHSIVFESDMKFDSFTVKPDPKDGTLIGKLVLKVDVPSEAAFDCFSPLLRLQGQFVDVFLGGTGITTKNVD
jgi:hypothetical protein